MKFLNVALKNKAQEGLSSATSSSRQNLKKLNDFVYEVYSHPQPDLEVVFFHGMREDLKNAYFTTWFSGDNSQMWLKTWLVEAFPTARILTLSYCSSPKRNSTWGCSDMGNHEENLVVSLTDDDGKVGQAGCPVVLVGHCVGGLILKQVCLTAASMLSRRGENSLGVKPLKDFVSNLRGMFYYGKCHYGGIPYYHGSILRENPIKVCARHNDKFRVLRMRYGWETAAIIEAKGAVLKHNGKSRVEVAARENDLDRLYNDLDRYDIIAADHYNVCRPEDKNTPDFRSFEKFLRKILEDSRAARQDFKIVPGNEAFVQWYDDPVRWKTMCDPVKCSDGMTYDRWTILKHRMTSSPYDRNILTLSILCDDISTRSRLFHEFPQQESKFKKRRRRYKEQALRHARADPIEFGDAIEKLNNVLKWLPIDTECQNELAAIQNRLSQGRLSAELPTFETATETRPYEIPIISHEDVIRANGRDFETRRSTFLVFLFIAVCFAMSIYSARI